MKTIVFGATGLTGLCLVPQLLKAGHEVTVYVRSPEKIAQLDGKIHVVKGVAEDAKAMQQALQGQEIVLSTFGNKSLKRSNIQETFMKNLVSGMIAANIMRLIDLSAWGVGDSYEQGNIFFKFIQATLLKANFEDKNAGETILLNSKINYTLVRPGRLTNGPARGNVKASLIGKDFSSTSISRSDVANFMVDQIQDNNWLRKAPLIGY